MGIVGPDTKVLQTVRLVVQSSGIWRGFGNLQLALGAALTIDKSAEFTVDSKSKLTRVSGTNTMVENNGQLTIPDGRQLTVEGNMLNRGTINVGLSSRLALASGSSVFAEGQLILDDNSCSPLPVIWKPPFPR